MKLSEIKGDRAIEVVADIMEPISNLLTDTDIKKIFENKKKQSVAKLLPDIIKMHKSDIYRILASLEGTTVNEYKKKVTIVKLIQDFTDLVTDESVQALFTSAKPVSEKN